MTPYSGGHGSGEARVELRASKLVRTNLRLSQAKASFNELLFQSLGVWHNFLKDDCLGIYFPVKFCAA